MLVFLLAASSCGAGCNLIIPGVILMGPPTKKVDPEFARLSGKRVVVLVWAAPGVLSKYRYARYDIAKYVADRLRSEIKDVHTVSVDKIEREIRSRPHESAEPGEIGRLFDADVVVYLELLRYQMRHPESPHLFRGDISASVTVFDLTEFKDKPVRYDLSAASVIHPEGAPISVYNTTEQKVRKETSEIFAETVVLKFKSHRVEI